MTNHPITPPPELVEQWRNLTEYVSQLRTMSTVTITTERLQHIATQAARWGADRELEACCEWLGSIWPVVNVPIDELRAARRTKPPSLKEQALAALQEAAYMADDSPPQGICSDQIDIIRRALEALPE